ncbi:MAG: hypothetical protein FWC60_12040, partial [Firmicutes bacterium]|nr:hypothetical protein [Bacillota bacterium]
KRGVKPERVEMPKMPKMPAKIETIRVQRPKLNPAFDPNRSYQPRSERKEWAAVGMVGRLIVRDDGSCRPNGFCRPNVIGIATASEQGYRVLKRQDTNKALVLLDGPLK